MGFEWLSVPILIVTLQLPQGALVYWLTSSLCSVGQSLLLGNASVRKALNLSRGGGYDDVLAKLSPEVMDLFLTAAERRAKGQHLDAIASLKEILKRDPSNARALYALGQLYVEQSQWDKAVQSYQDAVHHESNPTLKSRGLTGLGVAQMLKKDFDAAEKSLLQALELQKGDVTILLALCSLYKRKGDKQRFDTVLEHAIEVDHRCKQWAEHL